MIVIPAIITDKGATPKSVPETKFGNYFDGVNYYYFESEKELQTWRLQQEGQPQQPNEDAFFKEENILKLWEVLINNLEKITAEQLEKLKETLLK